MIEMKMKRIFQVLVKNIFWFVPITINVLSEDKYISGEERFLCALGLSPYAMGTVIYSLNSSTLSNVVFVWFVLSIISWICHKAHEESPV